MTRYEKLSTVLSVFALLTAIASPFISYRWLDPQLQAFRNRAKLQILPVNRKSAPERRAEEASKIAQFNETVKNFKLENESLEALREKYNQLLDELINGNYTIQVLNVGEIPAKDTLITAQYSQLPDQNTTSPIFNPPIPVEITFKDNLQFIALKRPIAPHDKITMTFPRRPASIWAYNEVGETSVLSTQPSWTVVDNQLIESAGKYSQ